MASIITNNSAMQALTVLNATNKNLSEVQSRISTGMKVADAKDNSAIYAVASVMRSDVSGFSTIKENLALAESSVAVARGASESIVGLLTEMKTKIVAAQDGINDRTKLQADIRELANQIKGVGSASQFNGQNYLKGTDTVQVLSSLDRDSSGVSNNYISFDAQNLVIGDAAPTAAATVAAGTTAKAAVASTTDLDILLDPTVGNNGQLDLMIGGVAATQIDLSASADSLLTTIATDMQTSLQTDFGPGVTVSVTAGKLRISDANGRGITGVAYAAGGANDSLRSTTTVQAGSTAQSAVTSESEYTIDTYKSGGTTYAAGDFTNVTLTRTDGTTANVDVSAAGSMGAVATALAAGLGAGYSASWDSSSGKLNVKDAQGRGIDLKFEGEKAGKLGALSTLNVTSTAGAKAALANVETMMQSAIDSASAFGSAQKRLGIQKDFMTQLGDALKSGIGTLVDADMTSESARLQALQVQQQLGTQALSIANQAPQNLLSLFRG